MWKYVGLEVPVALLKGTAAGPSGFSFFRGVAGEGQSEVRQSPLKEHGGFGSRGKATSTCCSHEARHSHPSSALATVLPLGTPCLL